MHPDSFREWGLSIFLEGIILGLTLGTTCLVTCGPIYGSLILQKEGDLQSGIKTVLLISLGRFISYAFFGVVVGYLGTLITFLPESDYFVAASYIAVAVYMIYSAFIERRKMKGCCSQSKLAKKAGNPFFLGLLTGVSVCPAFVGAIARGVDSGGALGGFMLFTGFFIGTTLYMVPLSFLSFFSRKKMFRVAGIAASILVSAWFFYEGSQIIYDKYNSYILNFTQVEISVVNAHPKLTQIDEVKKAFKTSEIKTVRFDEIEKTISEIKSRDVLLITAGSVSKERAAKLKELDKNILHIVVPPEKGSLKKQIEFVKYYSFKARKTRGFFYTVPVK